MSKREIGVLCGLVVASLAWAGFTTAREPSEARDWTSAAGTTIRARLLSPGSGDSVVLEREGGQRLTVKLAQLSPQDRAFIRELRAKSAMESSGETASGVKGDVTAVEETWYVDDWIYKEAQHRIVHNFALKAKGKATFEVEGEGDFYNVYFAVDKRKELQGKFGRGRYAFSLKQRNADGLLESTGGGGAPFQPQGGKIELEMTNNSEVDVRIAIFVDK